MTNQPEATVPAMDVERRAAELHGEQLGYERGKSPIAVQREWMDLSKEEKTGYRDRARSELTEEAKRAGDHDTLREMHGTLQTVTGAANPGRGAMSLMYDASDELAEAIHALVPAVRKLVLAIRAMDPTILDDSAISNQVAEASGAAEVVAELLRIEPTEIAPE